MIEFKPIDFNDLTKALATPYQKRGSWDNSVIDWAASNYLILAETLRQNLKDAS